MIDHLIALTDGTKWSNETSFIHLFDCMSVIAQQHH